jgi:hypothetical protein
MDVTPAEVIAKLGELAPGEIARLFTDLGIRGWPARSMSCPVAVYVRQETGVRVYIFGPTWRTIGCLDVVELVPQSVREFVDLFDDLCYPGLIDN